MVAVLALSAGVIVTRSGLQQVAVLAGLLPLLVALTMGTPRMVLVGLCVWLTFLGTIRRVLVTSSSPGTFGDPLLLVGPAAVILLFATAVGKGSLRDRTPLANSVGALTVLAVAETANPLQGSANVAIGGVLLVIVPLLAFWIGRALVNDGVLRWILGTVAALGIVAALYGLYQTYVGFPSWDLFWIHSVLLNNSYGALDVQGVIRAFASFSSGQEYVEYLSFAFVVWLTFLDRWILVSLAMLALLATGVFLESGRTSIVLLAVALAVMAAARAGLHPRGAVVAAAIGVGVLLITIGHIAVTPTRNGSPTSALISHQITGLSHPFNSTTSTFDGHVSRLVGGVIGGIEQPLGHGTGSITVAAEKYGGANQGTELDLSNAGEGFGLLGLLFYIFVLINALRTVYGLAIRRRDRLALAVLGLLVVSTFQWLNGGLYSVTWIVWLTLGWADRHATNDMSFAPSNGGNA